MHSTCNRERKNPNKSTSNINKRDFNRKGNGSNKVKRALATPSTCMCMDKSDEIYSWQAKHVQWTTENTKKKRTGRKKSRWSTALNEQCQRSHWEGWHWKGWHWTIDHMQLKDIPWSEGTVLRVVSTSAQLPSSREESWTMCVLGRFRSSDWAPFAPAPFLDKVLCRTNRSSKSKREEN